MIWGEVINLVRHIHLGLLQEFSLEPTLLMKDIELKGASDFVFPDAVDDFEEWDELVPSPSLEDILPHHPVERVLLEGPLLPIQKVKFHSLKEAEKLFENVLKLEKEWASELKILTPDFEKFLGHFCQAQALKLSTRLGFRKIGAV